MRKWHADLAKQAPRLRTKPGKKQRYRKQGKDDESKRRRHASANRTLTILKAALNHAWTHPPEGRELAVGGFDPEAWRKVKPFRGADVPNTL